MSFFCVALFRLFVSKFRYFELRLASFRHFAWRFFVISSFCMASFRYFVFSRGVFSLFRVALFRYFVFSRGVISLFRYFAWRYFVAKRRNGTNQPPYFRQMNPRIYRRYHLNERLGKVTISEGVSMQNSHQLQAMQK